MKNLQFVLSLFLFEMYTFIRIIKIYNLTDLHNDNYAIPRINSYRHLRAIIIEKWTAIIFSFAVTNVITVYASLQSSSIVTRIIHREKWLTFLGSLKYK